MPIRQPLQTTIYTSDFRNKPYCFVVESVLMPHDRVGLLTVSTSVGYSITTSLSKDPRREHTFPHYQQADTSWVAEGHVTLLATGDSPTDGMVTIRNSQGETVVITIESTSTPGLQIQQPALTLSEPLPAFARTVPGKPSYLILTIAQQYTNAPVTLTTDAPDYFQLASDSRPVFLSDLTLNPSATGTHVHIRYAAQKAGVHTGHLIIETNYQTRTIALKGRSSGLLPALRKPLSPVGQARLPQPAASISGQSTPAKRWMGGVALILAAGLAYIGYINRCQLFPALCATTPVTQSSPPVKTAAGSPSEKLAVNKAASKPVTTTEPLRPALRTLPANQATPAELPKEQPAVVQRTEQKRATDGKAVKPEANTQPLKQKVSPRPAVPSAEESDLERALNKPL